MEDRSSEVMRAWLWRPVLLSLWVLAFWGTALWLLLAVAIGLGLCAWFVLSRPSRPRDEPA